MRRLTRREQKEETRAALVEAAGRVIARRGLHGASIEAISAEAGRTGGAFYAHFASKEEIFGEVLEKRVFAEWRRLLSSGATSVPLTPRDVGEMSAAMNRHPDSRWVIRMWLELMGNAGGDDRFRNMAARLWADGRASATVLLTAMFRAAGRTPPMPPEQLVIAMQALETGLSLQHYADPDAVPAELIPELFERLFGDLAPSSPGPAARG